MEELLAVELGPELVVGNLLQALPFPNRLCVDAAPHVVPLGLPAVWILALHFLEDAQAEARLHDPLNRGSALDVGQAI